MARLSTATACAIALVASTVLAAPASAAPAVPTPVAPAGGATIIIPTFTWSTVANADHYQIQVGPGSDTDLVYWTGTSKNTRLTPNDANKFPNEALYWRVRAFASGGNASAWSDSISFTKWIPAPVLSSPVDAATISEPILRWQAASGAASYRVEVSTDMSFVPLTAFFVTYGRAIDPVTTIGTGIFYWRVAGIDANAHLGTWSSARSFTLTMSKPAPFAPANHASQDIPDMLWSQPGGAVRYEVQVAAGNTFVPVAASYLTYQREVTPTAALALGTWFWRVRGLDADGNAGAWSDASDFTLTAATAATDVAPQLVTPVNLATRTSDPTFCWTRSVGAASYRLVVDNDAGFTSPHTDSVITKYPCYTPYTAGKSAYTDGTYYWRVDARNGSGAVIATSAARTFTMARPVPLTSPPNGASLQSDPLFTWSRVPGARTYRIVVDTEAGFHTPYSDQVVTKYRAYAPYSVGIKNAYPNGTYFWRVEARSGSGQILATSSARSFTLHHPTALKGPQNGVTMSADPTFAWNTVIGARSYRLVVDKDSGFSSPYYDLVTTDYRTYTPYVGGGTRSSYANGTYYWRVDALSSSGALLCRSATRHFTINR